MKRALVTGSAGLIGRYTIREFESRGWDVVGIDRKLGHDARDFYRHDERSRYFDLVMHCAAHVGGREDIDGRPTYIAAVNTQLDGALFEWALRTRPAHIIYWSSSAAYPIAFQHGNGCDRLTEGDITFDHPWVPDASYGAVKLMGEHLADWARGEGLKVHVFRPFSGWAADQDLTYPVPTFLDRARRRADPFDVWGTGDQVRDFIHIEDVVNAALAAVDEDYPGPLNLCTGLGTSFNELADLVCKSAGYAPVIHHRPEKPVGVHYRVGDPTEMLKVWTPRISLEEGVERALKG